jgi:hypothetical protein
MKAINHLIFPTVISQIQHNVSTSEKEKWFELYLKNSNTEGVSQDFLGFEDIQTNTVFEDLFMNKLRVGINEYFKSLSIDTTKLDVHLTKCFFNVTNQSSIDIHDHSENHLSFTYYPYIAKSKDRDFIIYNVNEAHNNEPYPHFFSNYVTEWTEVNSNINAFPIYEGTMIIFPSRLKHCIESREGDSYEDGKSFKDKSSLLQSRFCVAGDMIYTRKLEIKNYNRALSNPKNWRSL